MDYNSPEFKKLVKNLQAKLKDNPRPQKQKVNFDITKQIGPLDTPTGYPEEKPEKEKVQRNPQKPKDGILNKIGSSIKKYITFKKFVREQHLKENYRNTK